MDTMASDITSLTIVYSTVYSGADKKTNIIAPRHWPLCVEFTGPRSSTQMASNAKSVSIWWRHHVITYNTLCGMYLLVHVI